MREYSKIAPTFWTGKTGRTIRSLGPDAQVVAFYLLSSPHSNMLGIYYLPIIFIAHETGLPLEGASKGLQRVSEAGFCAYDDENEVVWVYEMAKYQIGDLKPNDNRVKGINRDYQNLTENKFLFDFYERYKEKFHLKKSRGSKGPSKPLRSQEQEQEQEIDLSKDKSACRPHDPVDPPHEQKAPSGPPAGGSFPKKTSRHFSEKIPEQFLKGIDESCRKLDELSSQNGKHFNGWQFVQQMANQNKHPGAIFEALNGLVKLWDMVDNPQGWSRSIVKTKSGNYNEADHIKQAEEFKSVVSSSKDIKALLSDIGNRPGEGGT